MLVSRTSLDPFRVCLAWKSRANGDFSFCLFPRGGRISDSKGKIQISRLGNSSDEAKTAERDKRL